MKILAAVAVVVAVACASLTPSNARESIQPLANATGVCTAWSVGVGYWLTNKHCGVMAGWEGWEIGGAAAEVIAICPNADMMLLYGPVARPIPVAAEAPPPGARVMTYGYANKMLLWFDALVVNNAGRFFDGTVEDELILSGANGQPGMSGGPVIYRGEAVGMVSGGGLATSHSHLIGSAVTWRAIRDFVRLHVGQR